MGARDLDNTAWRRRSAIRERLRTFLDRRGYDAVELPTLEQTDLFLRKSGGELAARMYSFTDPSGRSVSLRPEFTSSVVRAYVDGSLRGPPPLRLQYAGPVFRYEPSADGSGALEYEQLGAELLGAAGEAADAEVVALAAQGLALLGVSGHRVRVSHVGVVNAILEAMGLTERARVFIHGSLGLLRGGPDGADEARRRAEALGMLSGGRARRLSALAARLDPDEAREMVEAMFADTVAAGAGQRTPEEILRRYLKKVREAEDPARVERALSFAVGLADAAGAPDAARKRIAELLAEHGLDDGLLAPLDRLFDALGRYDLMGAPLILDLGATSGIAYYTGVVFEVEHDDVAGAPPLGGGGRYDGLVKALGEADDVPALGFALSLERVSELLPDDFADDAPPAGRVLVTAQETAVGQAVATAERLRAQGIPAELDLSHEGDAAAAAYAKRRGIETIMRVGRDGRVDERPA